VTTQVPRVAGSSTGVQGSTFRVKGKDDIEGPILSNEFKDFYGQARRIRAVVRGFINYFNKYEERKATNREPDNLSSYNILTTPGEIRSPELDSHYVGVYRQPINQGD
jgi:hypothetical protein